MASLVYGITLKQLQNKHACEPQVDLFKKLFGESATFTAEQGQELALEYFDKFDITWASHNLLTVPARKECEKTRYSARRKYEKARDSASEEYEKARYSASEEYKKAYASALEEYEKVVASAWKEYEKAYAVAFVTAYVNQAAA